MMYFVYMKIRQIALGYKNFERATEFYKTLLQREPLATFNPPGFVFFDIGGTRLLLEANGPASLIYLEVIDVQAEIERLRANGVKVVSESHIVFPDPTGIFDTPGDEWLAIIEDSEGNLVGLMNRVNN